jgi:hypothetical protein
MPSFNNLVAVAPANPVGNPLLKLGAEIDNLATVLASVGLYFFGHINLFGSMPRAL